MIFRRFLTQCAVIQVTFDERSAKVWIKRSSGGRARSAKWIQHQCALRQIRSDSLRQFDGVGSGVTVPVLAPHHLIHRLDPQNTITHGSSWLIVGRWLLKEQNMFPAVERRLIKRRIIAPVE